MGRFARYDVDINNKKEEIELYKSFQDHYGGHLPCEGIVIICESDYEFGDEIIPQCLVEYEKIGEPINQNKIIQNGRENPEIICYWLDMQELYEANMQCQSVVCDN